MTASQIDPGSSYVTRAHQPSLYGDAMLECEWSDQGNWKDPNRSHTLLVIRPESAGLPGLDWWVASQMASRRMTSPAKLMDGNTKRTPVDGESYRAKT